MSTPISESYADPMSRARFSSYDGSYIFYDATNGWQTSYEPISNSINPEEGSLQTENKGDATVKCYSPNIKANHPGPPWFRWHAGSGHPGY